MVQLAPVPFDILIGRMFRELKEKKSIFDLPAQRFVAAYPGHDLSVAFRGRRAATPFGPAAGPHTQMAQNIALSWLAGGRVIECKTVQVNDAIEVPRPCIDMATVGYNVEWSQELTVQQSLEEYVKGAMLIEMLKASGIGASLSDTVFDMSVGYDLAGIRSAKVRGFLDGMLDATAVVDRLRSQIPSQYGKFRDLPFPTRISDSLTLSTFHGCPPNEIEGIVAHLIGDVGLDVVIKLNPTLLGREALDAILRDRLGYHDIVVPDRAFADDATWPEVVDLIGRLAPFAAGREKSLGVKFSNTLVVENTSGFFPASEPVMYLSGPPLHPLAIALVARFRNTFGDRVPVSFSGGIDEGNFADAVGLGLKPVTVCSDFLKFGGYRRGWRYFGDLVKRMDAVGAKDIEVFTLHAHGQAEAALADLGLSADRDARCRAALAAGGDPRQAAGDAFAAWVSAARVRNSAVYAERAIADRRYGAAENATPPKKIGSSLVLFDCLTCDKCIPVCPNDANFSFSVPVGETPVERLTPKGDGWALEVTGSVWVRKPHQIGAFADVCNECGHCDVLCPEDGGPYKSKPLFFGSRETFEAAPHRDGFVVEPGPEGAAMLGRFRGETVRVERTSAGVRYSGQGFDLALDPGDVAGSVSGAADGPVDLTRLRIMLPILDAVAGPGAVNYVSAGLGRGA
ncbi:putative selenate reductase [Roseiarcus fermentans]|uniref:Putative selenate reductase n=1 Tax=Roseiarcus fermentans TaxID=1473586 RepID=A0A366EW11_9HYPH|nr:glutamate synthase [Roseiarcus fermentans]RBP05675.1 putative selenate reductase [Roseiarcus fermentans]